MDTWDVMNRAKFKSSGATPFYWSDAVDRVCTPILCLKLATPLGRLCGYTGIMLTNTYNLESSVGLNGND